MKKNYIFIAAFLLFFSVLHFTVTAQMKSCCEPDGVKLVSTVKQTRGTLRMVHILDSISKNAKPEDFFFLNTQRIEMFKEKLAVEKDSYKRLELYFQYSNESLNAGNTDEAIAVIRQLMDAMKLTGENMTTGNKSFLTCLPLPICGRENWRTVLPIIMHRVV
ncbi:MAG: hypothetical protein IPL54_14575 [Chitinophagaceae bacterium]|nr:hypothetical protein [Chitinophagaceae bacterium]